MSSFEMSPFMDPGLPAGSLSLPAHGKEALAERAAGLMTSEFIESRIRPLCALFLNGHRSECQAAIVQNAGTGRLTLKYVFGVDCVVFAKLYVDELGPHCYQVNRALWEAGFNDESPFRVPKPIGFLPDQGLLLMRGVKGKPLGSVFDGDSSIDLVSGCQKAGEWLASLHRTALRIGAPDTDWDSLKLFRLASRLIKAAAMRPEKLDMIRELLEQLEERTNLLRSHRRFVFTHGRFHHDHVFLENCATSVIDLDRCRPSDPAKDAAEFVRVLRLTAFKEGFDMDVAQRATDSFLSAYLDRVPEAMESLGAYWATYVFHSLLGGLKKGRTKGRRTWEELEQFYIRELTLALDFGR
jgi:hypothetical protein